MKRSKQIKNGTKKPAGKALICLSALILFGLFIYFGPAIYEDRLDSDPYREWLEHQREPAVSVINVWHIVGFKPLNGSLGGWLEKRAKRFSSQYIGIHFEVFSMTAEQSEKRAERGEKPDIISFSNGSLKPDIFLPIGDAGADNVLSTGAYEGEQLAFPYCATGELYLFHPETGDSENPKSIGTVEEFRNGKAAGCVTDIRGAGDLYRAQLMGSCEFFEITPYEQGRFSTQYIGVSKTIDEKKLGYAIGFIEYLTSAAAQRSLADIGLLPVYHDITVSYEYDWLNALKIGFSEDKIPGAF